MTSGLRQLYPRVKARPSSGWGSFVLSVLQMAVPTSGSLPAHPPRRPLAIGIADRPADSCFSRVAVRQSDRTPDGGGRSYGRPPLQLLGRPPKKNSRPLQVSSRPSAGRPPSRLPGGRQPPSHRPFAGRPQGRPIGPLLASSVTRPSARPSTT